MAIQNSAVFSIYSPSKYGSAKEPTVSSQCTNVPIYHPHRKITIWKYNAAGHIITTHPRLDVGLAVAKRRSWVTFRKLTLDPIIYIVEGCH